MRSLPAPLPLLTILCAVSFLPTSAVAAAATGCSSQGGGASQTPETLPPLAQLTDDTLPDDPRKSHLVQNLSLGALFEEDTGYLIGATLCRESKCTQDSGSYVLINLVEWKTSTSANSTWYIFRGGKNVHWSEADFRTNDRLYGAKHTYLLSIQIGGAFVPKLPAYSITENKRIPTNVQDLEALVQNLPSGKGGGALASAGIYWTGREIPRQYPGAADICISTTIPKPGTVALPKQDPSTQPATTPIPPGASGSGPEAADLDSLANYRSEGEDPSTVTEILARNQEATPPPPAPQPPALTPPKPAPPVVAPGAPGGGGIDTNASVQLPDFSVTDEPKAWWDVSVAVPVSKISAVQYSSVNNVVTPSTVNRQTAFGVLDIFAPKVDLTKTLVSVVPHPLVGVSMGSKPLQSWLFGGALGFTFGQVFVGANLLKQQSLSTGLTSGSTASPTQLSNATSKTWQAHFVVGINLSVKSAFAAIKNSTSSTSSK